MRTPIMSVPTWRRLQPSRQLPQSLPYWTGPSTGNEIGRTTPSGSAANAVVRRARRRHRRPSSRQEPQVPARTTPRAPWSCPASARAPAPSSCRWCPPTAPVSSPRPSVGSGAGTVVSGVDGSVVGGSVVGGVVCSSTGGGLLGRCRVGLVRRRRGLVGLGTARGRHGHGANGSGDHGRPDEVGETVGTHGGTPGW